jgi:hypothetical protein
MSRTQAELEAARQQAVNDTDGRLLDQIVQFKNPAIDVNVFKAQVLPYLMNPDLHPNKLGFWLELVGNWNASLDLTEAGIVVATIPPLFGGVRTLNITEDMPNVGSGFEQANKAAQTMPLVSMNEIHMLLDSIVKPDATDEHKRQWRNALKVLGIEVPEAPEEKVNLRMPTSLSEESTDA